jgi:hypothetical protein
VKQLACAALVVAAMGMLSSCGSGSGAPAGSTGTPGQPPGTLQITSSPALTPAFDPAVSDYVVAAKPGSAVQVSVNAPSGTRVSVDSKPFAGVSGTTPVTVAPGQSFSFVVTSAGTSKTYFVRRLPTDFPVWSTTRSGTPQSEYYVIAPTRNLSAGNPSPYAIIVDANGVPMWWYRASDLPVDAKLLPNGNVGLTVGVTAEERSLDGKLVRTITGAGILGALVDAHELLLLPNGDYVVITILNRFPANLSGIGGSASTTVIDNVIAEYSPGGALVWQWSAMDHIPVSEIDPQFVPLYVANVAPADPYHMNSVEADGNGFVVSVRHMSAVYRIDKASGNIVWKLGGTRRAESLTFAGDTFGNFGGQHDARLLADGTMTLHDNGTGLGRGPRAARYQLDTGARTATEVEQVTDPSATASACCGSARKLPGGDWVMSWGANSIVTEMSPGGSSVFRLTFPAPYFSYRAAPIPFGTLTREALRKGMDTQFPR